MKRKSDEREFDEKLLAAVDVGTNSFHLVIVRLLPDGGFAVVGKEKIVVRLGEAPRQMKHLTESAMQRGVEAITLFRHMTDRKRARIRAVATSAVREALNGTEFIDRVRKETGVEMEVVSGFEEARLIYLGVLQALPIYDRTIALFDIGGGSTEVLVGNQGTPLYANSFKIGAIRMTQRFLPDEKVKQKQVDRLRLYVRGELYFASRKVRERKPDLLIASSGTAQTIAAMAVAASGRGVPDHMNGIEVTLEEVRPIVERILAAETNEERAAIPGCDPRRADILAAGAVVLQTTVQELGFDRFTISGYALREGIILDTIQKKRGSRGDHPARLRDQRFDSVIKLGRTYDFDEAHARHVAQLSLSIFDQLQEVHKLGADSRELLEAGAMLHDVGYYISPAAHHKHALYLIKNSAMFGFNREEIDLVANIARYHRKSHPKERHAEFAALGKEDKRRVPILAGILRIADTLDRTHRQLVSSIECTVEKKTLTMQIESEDEADLSFELWSVSRRKGLLGRSLDIAIEMCTSQATVSSLPLIDS